MKKQFLFLSMLILLSIQAVWAANFTQGDGSQTNPYQINQFNDLVILSEWVQTNTPTTGKYFKLMTDIDMSSIIGFVPIGGWSNNTTNGNMSFAGNFDGNNHIISGLMINHQLKIMLLYLEQ